MDGNDRAIVGLVMAAHALVHTYELSVPILVSIWLAEFPVTEAGLGVVVTAGMALFGLGALPGGVLADRIGSRRLIAGALAGMGGAFLVLGAASSVVGVALALIVWGVAASVYHPAGLTLISTGVRERGRGLALHGAAGNVGIAFGPLITTLLLIGLGWRAVVWVLAVPALLAAPVAFRVDIDERAAVTPAEADGGTPEGVDSVGTLLRESRRLFGGVFAGVFLVVMCSGLYYRGTLTFLPELLGGLEAFTPVRVRGVELQPARYLYAGLLTVGVGGQYVGGWLSDRIDAADGLAVAFAGLAGVTLLFLPAAAAGVGPLLVASAVLGFALFSVQPLYQATVAEATPASLRGLSYGYMYLGVFGVGALGATVAGWLLTYGSRPALFGTLAAIAGAAAALSLRLRGRLG